MEKIFTVMLNSNKFILFVCFSVFTEGIFAQSFEMPIGPFLDSSTYVPPKPSTSRSTINFTAYKQCNQSWSNSILGTCYSPAESVCMSGCVMVDVAMILTANSVNVDPGQLNTWLTNNSGYGGSGCALNWIKILSYPGTSLSWYGSATYSLSTIKAEIDGGNPVIVHVDHRYGGTGTCGHFVLVYGYNNLGTNTSDFLVSDPGTVTCPTGCNLSYYSVCSQANDPNPLRIYRNVSSTCSPPSNDNCPGRSIASNGVCLTSQTVACATGSYGANNCSGSTSPDDKDVYYYFTGAGVSHNITVSNYASNFDAVIEVRSACASGSGNVIGCVDPAGTPSSVTYTTPVLTNGVTYYIRVFEYNNTGTPPSSPTFDICVTHTATGQPDLSITAGTQTVSPTTVCAGATVSASCSEDNMGNATAGSNSVTLWLSADAVLSTSNDTYLGTISGFPSLSQLSNSIVYTNSAVTIPSGTAAGTYYLFYWADGLNGSGSGNVVSESNESNNYASKQITIQNCCSASNDNCSGTYPARAISFGTSCSPVSASSCGATSSGFSSCSGTQDDDVFFSFVPNTSSATITVASSTGYDAVFQVLTGPCSGSMTQLACVNNTGTGGTESTTVTGLTTGTTYYIRVWHSGASYGTTGDFTICAYGSSCTPPSQSGTITGATSVCQNALQTYSISQVSGATSYTWSLPASWSGNGSTSTSVNTSVGSSGGTISVTANNSCGSSTPRTLSVTVNQLPSQPSTISGPTSVCQGTTQTYTVGSVSGATSYTWTLPSGWSGSSTSNSISVMPSSSAGTISVTANNNCGSSTPKTLSVSINTLPAQPSAIIGSTSVCSGSSQSYSINTVSGATSYTWTYSGSSSPTGTNTSTSFNPTMSGILSVVANNACGNSSANTLAITVNQTPSISINPPNVSICSGGSGTTLQAIGSAQSYSWSPSSGLSSTSGQMVSANPTTNTTYTLTASNGNCSATATSVVTISNQITALITPSNPLICGNGTVSLSVTPGSTYVWSGPNNFSGSTQTISVSNAGIYSVTVTNPGGCVGSATANVTVTLNPALIVNAGVNQVIQSGTSTQLGGAPTASGGTPPYLYSWSPTATLNNSSASNPLSSPTVNTSYNLTVTDSKGCSATDNVQVNISSGCQTYILDSLAISIPHDSATYFINLTTGAGCPWTVLEGCNWLSFSNTSGNGTSTLTFIVNENSLTSPRTCYVNIEGNILVITQGQTASCLAPVPSFTASKQAIFAGNSISFTDNSFNIPTQWEWSFSGGNPTMSTLQNPTVTYSSGGIFDVTLKASNSCGSNTITKTNYINVIGTVGIDNAVFDNNISIYPNPNNGTFRLVAQTTTQKTIQLKLFSAIGQLVYNEEFSPTAYKIEKDISVGNIVAGVYLLQITINNKTSYRKLIVE